MGGLWAEPVDTAATLSTQNHRSIANLTGQGFQQITGGGIDDPVGVIDEE
mgnify:FL=1